MRIERPLFLRNFLPHGNGNIPRTVTIVTHPTYFLTHKAGGAGVYDFLEFRSDGVQAVKYALGHEPTRFWRETLKTIVLIGGTLGFKTRLVFHWVDRTVAVTRAAEDASCSSLIEALVIEPPLHPFKPKRLFWRLFHNSKFFKV
jgi:hypothetical protein